MEKRRRKIKTVREKTPKTTENFFFFFYKKPLKLFWGNMGISTGKKKAKIMAG